MKSTRDALRTSAEFLASCGIEDAGVEAELLLAFAVGVPREKLVMETLHVEHEVMANFNRYVSRRAESREPFAYIVGTAGFMDLEVEVTPSVLIPRPSTEALVQRALEIPAKTAADIGTGSGVIAVFLATKRQDLKFTATDVSKRAISVAGRNAKRFGVADRIVLLDGPLLKPLADAVDLIVTNPPYIPTDILDTLAPEVQCEPREALDGGPDGLTVIRDLIPQAKSKLTPGGTLLLEFGIAQGDEVMKLAKDAGFSNLKIHKDLDGHDRVLEAR